MRPFIVALASVALLAVLALAGCGGSSEPSEPQGPEAVAVEYLIDVYSGDAAAVCGRMTPEMQETLLDSSDAAGCEEKLAELLEVQSSQFEASDEATYRSQLEEGSVAINGEEATFTYTDPAYPDTEAELKLQLVDGEWLIDNG